MSVSLLSNIPHYHHLAEAFDQAGTLDRYVTVLSQMSEKNSSLVPDKIRKKMISRRLRVAASKVKQLFLPEGLQKIPPKLGFYSSESGCYINNYLFDYLASRSIPESRVVHFVSSIGLLTARRAKKRGATIICDSRQDHPLFQSDVLDDEAKRLGLKSSCIPNLSYRDKMLREFDLADHIVVPSTHTKRTFVARGYDDQRIHVLNYGVESHLFHPMRTTDGIFRVLYTGQIAYRKGVQYLLEEVALALLLFAVPMNSQESSPSIQRGTGLLSTCQDDSIFFKGVCRGYVLGVTDTSTGVCVPPGVNVKQIVDLIVQYLEQHPSTRQDFSYQLILRALHETWPCGTN
jgi:glycosyltransferase involved in cell wall biosynthesis